MFAALSCIFKAASRLLPFVQRHGDQCPFCRRVIQVIADDLAAQESWTVSGCAHEFSSILVNEKDLYWCDRQMIDLLGHGETIDPQRY